MNVYQQYAYHIFAYHPLTLPSMLRTSISSALILEDDADWDIFLRPQLLSFARGLRFVQNITFPPLSSPYGDSWDILTIGHTGINNRPAIPQRYWVTSNDPTVIPDAQRTWSRKPNLTALPSYTEHDRLVTQVSKLTGTAAYAISLRGAARMLHDQALLPHATAIDMAISNMCNRNTLPQPFCYGTYPMLIGRYRAIGPKYRDSDRRTSSNEAESGSGGGQDREERKEAESEFTVYPVSLNAGRLMRGEAVVKANGVEKEVDVGTFVMPRGWRLELEEVGQGDRGDGLRRRLRVESESRE